MQPGKMQLPSSTRTLGSRIDDRCRIRAADEDTQGVIGNGHARLVVVGPTERATGPVADILARPVVLECGRGVESRIARVQAAWNTAGAVVHLGFRGKVSGERKRAAREHG
eukprot:scaffold459_cov117-Isochrysis_galbana.AAC.9